MNIDRIVHVVAGSLVLASLLGALVLSPHFLWLAAFVGLNLVQSGLTNWCFLSRILQRAGLAGDKACGLAPRLS